MLSAVLRASVAQNAQPNVTVRWRFGNESVTVRGERPSIELSTDPAAVIVHDIHHPHGRFVNVRLEEIAGIRRWDSSPAPRT